MQSKKLEQIRNFQFVARLKSHLGRPLGLWSSDRSSQRMERFCFRGRRRGRGTRSPKESVKGWEVVPDEASDRDIDGGGGGGAGEAVLLTNGCVRLPFPCPDTGFR